MALIVTVIDRSAAPTCASVSRELVSFQRFPKIPHIFTHPLPAQLSSFLQFGLNLFPEAWLDLLPMSNATFCENEPRFPRLECYLSLSLPVFDYISGTIVAFSFSGLKTKT